LVVPSAVSAADPALVVLAAATPRTVDLRLVGGPPRAMTGVMRLVLRNAGTKSLRLRLRYSGSTV
jgi:hypothetical protein